ncbi:hypothetical protein IAT38_002065 [Cryptococcus sp. DSM 104549]
MVSFFKLSPLSSGKNSKQNLPLHLQPSYWARHGPVTIPAPHPSLPTRTRTGEQPSAFILYAVIERYDFVDHRLCGMDVVVSVGGPHRCPRTQSWGEVVLAQVVEKAIHTILLESILALREKADLPGSRDISMKKQIRLARKLADKTVKELLAHKMYGDYAALKCNSWNKLVTVEATLIKHELPPYWANMVHAGVECQISALKSAKLLRRRREALEQLKTEKQATQVQITARAIENKSDIYETGSDWGSIESEWEGEPDRELKIEMIRTKLERTLGRSRSRRRLIWDRW